MKSAITVITREQFENVRSYLDEDCQSHLAVHQKWTLDAGKFLTALETAGIVVETAGNEEPK
jgi:hypothetical protein